MRLVLFILMAGLAMAEQVTKVVDIHNNKDRLVNLVQSRSVNIKFDQQSKFVVLQGEKEEVEAIEEVLKKIDLPLLNLEFTFELISGSKSAGKPTDVPVALGGVAKEMKSLFGFQSVTLIDTTTIRMQDGKDSSANGTFPSLLAADANPPKGIYSININQAGWNGTKGSRLVSIAQLRFNAKIPFSSSFGGNTQYTFSEMGIQTGLDVKEGQRVVVGKVGMDSGSNPFFLVVSCKVVE